HRPIEPHRLVLDRQIDDERRSLTLLALDPEPAAVLLDDSIAERQPQAGPLPLLFGREEGFQDPLEDFGRDAGTVVRDPHLDASFEDSRGQPDRVSATRLD